MENHCWKELVNFHGQYIRNYVTSTKLTTQWRSFTATLLQDLLCSGVIVCQWVAGIAVLVKNVSIRNLILQTPRNPHMRLRRVESGRGWGTNNFSTQSTENIHLRDHKTQDYENTHSLATQILAEELLRNQKDLGDIHTFHCTTSIFCLCRHTVSHLT